MPLSPMHHRIYFPNSIELAEALRVAKQIGAIEQCSELVLDFGGVGHIEPFGMLLLSGEIRRLKNRFPEATFTVTNHLRMTYAAHMGFFKAFGAEFGNEPGEARGSATYVPVTHMDCAVLGKV